MRSARQPDPATGRPRRAADRPPESEESSRAALGFYLTQGFSFAVVLLVFTGLGYWLDGRLHTLPLLTLLGAATGGIGGFLHLYRTLTAERHDRDATS